MPHITDVHLSNTDNQKENVIPPHIPPVRRKFPFDGIFKTAPVFRMDYKYLSMDQNVNEADLLNLRDFRRIATYNFASPHSKLPFGTMIIPGAPRIYNPHVQSGQLQEDGYFFSDINAYSNPKCPLEPVFRAIDICQGGSFDYEQFDIVSDAYCLMILNFYCYNQLQLDEEPVRFDIQRAGNLVAFSRFEKMPVFKISHEQGPSFGINFKKYVTSREEGGDLTESFFQQVFTCSFGHFKLIVNSKVDCAIEKGTSTIKLSDDGTMKMTKKYAGMGNGNPIKFNRNSELRYVQYGKMTDFDVVELATRKETKSIWWHRLWHRILFTGAVHLMIGRLDTNTGVLHRVEDVTRTIPRKPVPKVKGGIAVNGLREMHYVLRKIVEFVRKKEEDKRFSCVFEEGKPMKLFERKKEDHPNIIPDYHINCHRT